ncbi:hypothetical protein [Rosistilla oblonga]|uniref:hypothetical protein n=1 Tax=Rosistilla oblonga TaxID=2527990 RepID=UPI003A96BC62
MIRCFATLLLASLGSIAFAATTTWDGKYSTERIDVTVVYFVPSDRVALPDWRDRLDYYCRRIEQFHRREFGTQSVMKANVHPEPLVSESDTATLRRGDANAIYYRTLSEVERRIGFGRKDDDTFPILLVLSDINWRALDDFYRLHPDADGTLKFEGNLNNGQHFPGAASGGSRASYISRSGVGRGLVSGDGWRVPYRGSDCVIYHEGCGHTVGLPHPEPQNGSVMSVGQYRGWINQSWLDKEQKLRMNWQPETIPPTSQMELFDAFSALPEPMVPKPGEPVQLKLQWPDDAKVKSLRVRVQTAIDGAWVEIPQAWDNDAPELASVGRFDRPTPVSYRIDAQLESGATAELWGYLQVRSDPNTPPQPMALSKDLFVSPGTAVSNAPIDKWPQGEVDLLDKLEVEKCWTAGEWKLVDGVLESNKAYGVRIQLPYTPPEEYRMTVIVEPLDEINALLLGQRSGENRFMTLLNFRTGDTWLSALENVGGRNVGNETTFKGKCLVENELSEVIVTVRKSGVQVEVDGHTTIDWKGDRSALSIGDYWSTPDKTKLVLGSYNCRYRFHRVSILPL